MITKESVFKIGRLQKSYGIRGEINIIFDQPNYADIDVDFYFMDIDSTYVPFLIEEINFVGDTRGRVKFEDVDNENTAARYSNIDIYIMRSEMPEIEEEDASDWDWFIGFDIIDQHNHNLGKIEDVDIATMNVLFIVKNEEEKEYLIPATEDFITKIDEENKTLYLTLPEGLLE